MTHSIEKKMLALALVLSSLSVTSLFAGKPGDGSGSGGGSTPTDVRITGPFPLPIFNVHDGFQPVQASATCHIPIGAAGCSTPIFAVPVGKRLVIEYFSGDGFPPAGQSIKPSLTLNIGGANIEHHAPITTPAPSPNSASFGGVNTVSWGQQVRLYADPGTTVNGTAIRSDPAVGNLVGISISISGYLVDIQ